MIFNIDQMMMQEALKQAKLAAEKDEVPIGAVITFQNRIISRAHNQVETLKDPTAHAEMIAITQATNYLSSKWLQDCSMYVSLEPCSMCSGALVLSRIKKLFYGASDPKTGACGSVMNIGQHDQLNHRIEIYKGIFDAESAQMLSDFFKKKRKVNTEENPPSFRS
jgi:tRNA(adenine34) deaminase